jgi:WD40 repeat protein
MRMPLLAAMGALALGLLPPSAIAQDAEPKVDPRVDNYGDPLPPGALLRLGTIRLQGGRFAWMPDGKSLVTTSAGKIWIWDVEDGRALKSIPSPIQFLAGLTPDGSKLIGNSAEERLVIFDLNAETSVSPAETLETYELSTFAIAPDGTSFATGMPPGAVRVWDTATGRPLLNLSIENASPRELSLAFSPDSHQLAVGTGRTIQLYDLEDASKTATIEGTHGRETTSLAFTRDGKQLISAGTSDRETRITPDGKRVSTEYCEVSIWDVAERKRQGTLEFPERMKGTCVMALAPDGNTLITMHRGKSFVWDLADRKIVRTLEGIDSSYWRGGMRAAVDPTGKHLAASLHETHVRVYDLATGERAFADHQRHSAQITAVTWSHDGRSIATASSDGAVTIWDAASGRRTQVMKHAARWVRGLAFTADDAALMVGAETMDEIEARFVGALSRLNVADGELVFELPLPDRVTTVALSRDGKKIAVAAGFGRLQPREAAPPRIHVFAVPGGKKLADIEAGQDYIESLSWSEDGSAVSTVEHGNMVRSFEVASGRELSKLETPHERESMGRTIRARVRTAEFLSDRKTVLTNGSFTGEVHAWDMATGELVWSLDTEAGYIARMAASPDGRIVALHGREAIPGRTWISIWDTAMRRELLHLNLEEENAYSMAFSPDGSKLVTGFESGTALVWDVSPAWEKIGGKDSGR